MIFQEMWKFTNDFQKTVEVGVCILNYHIISCVHCFYAGCETEYLKPISSSWFTKNFQLMQQGGVFGSNKDNVERILKRMANAIQMDLGRQ